MQFFQLITDDRKVIHRIEIVNEHMIEVFHNFQEETIPVQTNVNIFIACFTTSYARLKLYDALDTLQERLIYMHTDSVIYIQKPGEPSIPTGNYLRQYTNEPDEGDHIVEFVVAGQRITLSILSRESKHAKSGDSHSMCVVRTYSILQV